MYTNSFFFFSIIKSIPELTISRLLVSSADQSDAGNYACSSEAGYSNTTAIHVITGKIYEIQIKERNQVKNCTWLDDIFLFQNSFLPYYFSTHVCQWDLNDERVFYFLLVYVLFNAHLYKLNEFVAYLSCPLKGFT